MGQKSSVGTSGAGKGLQRNPIVPESGKGAAFLANHLRPFIGTDEQLSADETHQLAKKLASNLAAHGITILDEKEHVLVEGEKNATAAPLTSGVGNAHDLFYELDNAGVSIVHADTGKKITSAGKFEAHIEKTSAKPVASLNSGSTGFKESVADGKEESSVKELTPEAVAALAKAEQKDNPLSNIGFGDLENLGMTHGEVLDEVKEVRKQMGLGDVYTPASRKDALAKMFKGQPLMEILYSLLNTGKDASLSAPWTHYASEHGHKIAGALTNAEKGALIFYTGSGSSTANFAGRQVMPLFFDYLKEKDPALKKQKMTALQDKLSYWKNNGADKLLQLIYEGIAAAPKKNWVIARGTDLPSDVISKIKEHETFYDYGALSTTKYDNENGPWKGSKDQFVAVTNIGIDVQSGSLHSSEKEILLPPGMIWYVYAKLLDVPAYQDGYGGNHHIKNGYLIGQFDAEEGGPALTGLHGEIPVAGPRSPEEQEKNPIQEWDEAKKQWKKITDEEQIKKTKQRRKNLLDPLIPSGMGQPMTAKAKQKRVEKLVNALPAAAQQAALWGGPIDALFSSLIGAQYEPKGILPMITDEEIQGSLSGTKQVVQLKMGNKKTSVTMEVFEPGKNPLHTLAGAISGNLYTKLTQTPVAVALSHNSKTGSLGIAHAYLPGSSIEGTVADGLGKLAPEQQKEFSRRFLDGFLLDVLLGNHYVLGQTGEKVQIVKTASGKLLPVRIKNVGTFYFHKSGPLKSQDEINKTDVFFEQFQKGNPTYANLINLAGYTPKEFKEQILKQYETLEKFRNYTHGFKDIVGGSIPGVADMNAKEFSDILEKRFVTLKEYIDKMPE